MSNTCQNLSEWYDNLSIKELGDEIFGVIEMAEMKPWFCYISSNIVEVIT